MQFAPQGLGEHHVEGLGCAVRHHVGATDETSPGPEHHDPASAPLDHGCGVVMAELHRHHAVALHHRLGGFDRIGQKRCEVGIGARAVHQEADLEVGGRVDHRGGRTGYGEIDCQGAGFDAVPLADARGDIVEYRLPACEQHHVESTLGQRVGEGRTHPVGGTRDHSPRAIPRGEVVAHENLTCTLVNTRRAIRQPASVRTISSS